MVIFLYAVFVAIVIGWGEHYGLYLRERASMTFIMMPVRIFFSLFPIVIGILIGLPEINWGIAAAGYVFLASAKKQPDFAQVNKR